MATLVKRITWDKIKVGDRIRVEDGTDIIEFTAKDIDEYGEVYTSESNCWIEIAGSRVYRLKEDV